MPLFVSDGKGPTQLPSSPVPVVDGGTGATSAANALTNLGGLDQTAHDALDHSMVMGIPGPSGMALVHQQVGEFTSPAGSTAETVVGPDAVIPANTLDADGKSLWMRAWVRVGEQNPGAGDWSVRFGATSGVPGGNTLIFNAPHGISTNEKVRVDVVLKRLNATTVLGYYHVISTGAGVPSGNPGRVAAFAANTAVELYLQLTHENASAANNAGGLVTEVVEVYVIG